MLGTAADGAQSDTALPAAPPDVMLMDIRMTDTDGIQPPASEDSRDTQATALPQLTRLTKLWHPEMPGSFRWVAGDSNPEPWT